MREQILKAVYVSVRCQNFKGKKVQPTDLVDSYKQVFNCVSMGQNYLQLLKQVSVVIVVGINSGHTMLCSFWSHNVLQFLVTQCCIVSGHTMLCVVAVCLVLLVQFLVTECCVCLLFVWCCWCSFWSHNVMCLLYVGETYLSCSCSQGSGKTQRFPARIAYIVVKSRGVKAVLCGFVFQWWFARHWLVVHKVKFDDGLMVSVGGRCDGARPSRCG